MASMKLPPDPSTAKSYSLWKKDAQIWEKLTDVAKGKRGLALQFACQGNLRIKEAVVNIEDDKVDCDDGFKNVLEVLDGLLKVDDKEAEMIEYQAFETIRREDSQTIADFINEFDGLVNKTKARGNVMSENLLALKVMRAANLTKSQQQTIRASTAKLEYKEVKSTMKRMFGESTDIKAPGSMAEQMIKAEPILQSSHREKSSHCACNNSKESHQSGNFDGDGEEGGEEILYGYKKDWRNNSQKPSDNYKYDSRSASQQRKGRNPLDPKGNVIRCNVCESINHWAGDCPDKVIKRRCNLCESINHWASDCPDQKKGKEGTYYNITMFQNDLENSNMNEL